jgi:hypothetical protein
MAAQSHITNSISRFYHFVGRVPLRQLDNLPCHQAFSWPYYSSKSARALADRSTQVPHAQPARRRRPSDGRIVCRCSRRVVSERLVLQNMHSAVLQVGGHRVQMCDLGVTRSAECCHQVTHDGTEHVCSKGGRCMESATCKVRFGTPDPLQSHFTSKFTRIHSHYAFPANLLCSLKVCHEHYTGTGVSSIRLHFSELVLPISIGSHSLMLPEIRKDCEQLRQIVW